MWAKGRQAIHECRSGSIASRTEVASADAATASCVSTAALG